MPTTTAPKSDLERLLELNRDYITSVQTSDVRRFDEILAGDFLCTNPDASMVDRDGFLRQTARPAGITKLATPPGGTTEKERAGTTEPREAGVPGIPSVWA